MAIQLPDPGTGVPADKTGDSPWLAMKKVRENFNDQTNAASRLVGTAARNVMEVGAFGVGSPVVLASAQANTDLASAVGNIVLTQGVSADAEGGALPAGFVISLPWTSGSVYHLAKQLHMEAYTPGLRIRQRTASGAAYSPWYAVYTTANTTKDGNGFLKAASPIVKVFADKVELNDDAVNQNVTYKKNGVGDYTITTVSGLSTDGWYIELPKDMNGNPKVAVTLSEVDGVISLKTYKRIFSMETFTFEPDLDNPLDVPDGRWIDLRLNEIPVELPDDIQTEV